ncbi:MAG: hypothetical protein HRT89_12855, partial [Lentisphaeria bacterium]|nr:hypothetical protein [Lentisphaeria bacterium]NQZ68948.1 hypothetical protein [Lentisphaeria bacterium]
MKIDLKIKRSPSHHVSTLILGQNIETCLDTVPGLLSDRLKNPKFLGPPHPMTGLAPGWEGGGSLEALKVRHALGSGQMGSEAVYLEGLGSTIAQSNCKIAGDETLIVEL